MSVRFIYSKSEIDELKGPVSELEMYSKAGFVYRFLESKDRFEIGIEHVKIKAEAVVPGKVFPFAPKLLKEAKTYILFDDSHNDRAGYMCPLGSTVYMNLVYSFIKPSYVWNPRDNRYVKNEIVAFDSVNDSSDPSN